MTESLINLLFIMPVLCLGAWLLVERLSPPRMMLGLQATKIGNTVRLRPTSRRTIGLCLAIMGFSPFVVLVGAFLATEAGHQWSIRNVLIGICALTISAGLVSYWRIGLGCHDIVLDGQQRVMRFSHRELAYDQIEHVEVRRREESHSDATWVYYSIWVVLREQKGDWQFGGGNGEDVRDEVRQLARFVAQHVAVPAYGETNKEIMG